MKNKAQKTIESVTEISRLRQQLEKKKNKLFDRIEKR